MPRYYIPPIAEEMEFSLEDLCQNELKQIEMENRLTVLMDENISCMQALSVISSVKKALVGGRLDAPFLSTINRNGELTELLGFELFPIEESGDRAREKFYMERIDIAMESWQDTAKKVLEVLYQGFIEFFKDFIYNNRRYRYQLQRHQASLNNNLSAYCDGSDRYFGNLTVISYHCSVWRELYAGIRKVNGTFADLTNAKTVSEYLEKNMKDLQEGLKPFGQGMTNTGVVTVSRGPERKRLRLGRAQWKLGDLSTYCANVIGVLIEEQTADRLKSSTMRRLDQTKSALANGVKEEIDAAKEEMRCIKSLLHRSYTNTGAVARNLLMICNAARNWKPGAPTDTKTRV
jgi:hypothetical protein